MWEQENHRCLACDVEAEDSWTETSSVVTNVLVGGILGLIHHNGLFGRRISDKHSPFYQSELGVGLKKVFISYRCPGGFID